MTAQGPAEPPSEGLSQPSSEDLSGPPSEDLSRLASLHGVGTSYSPAPDRTVAASATAVTLALAALGVDAGSPEAVRAALAARERELGERLLPPTVVLWSGAAS